MVLVLVLDYATETALLLFSGCVALLVLASLSAGVTFLVCRQLKNLSPRKKSFDDSKIEVDVCDEPVSRDRKSELTSQHESNFNASDARIDHRWFVKRDESGAPKFLRTLRDHLPIKVALIKASNYDKDGEIREYLEHLVGRLISENLDDVPLTPLSDDERYTEIFTKYHPKISTILTTLSESLHSDKDSESLDDAVRPSTLYGQLQSVIREVQEDAYRLPPLADYDAEFGPASIETHLEGQTYEDILTTAVLNKLVSRSQTKNGFSKENIADTVKDAGDPIKIEKKNSSPNEKFSLLIEEHIEEVTTRYKVVEDETDSIISTSTNVNALNKHRAQCPELGKDIVDVGYNSDEDDVTEVVTNIDSWEDNWLFQRRKKNRIKNAVWSQISVPMLVPNPSEKYRALIGGVDVDETSDLSECSDSFIEDIIEFIPRNLNGGSAKTNYIYKYDFDGSLETPTFKNDVDNESEGFGGDHDLDSSGVTSISRDVSSVYSFSSASPCRSDEDSMSWSGVREAKNEHLLLAQVDSGEGSLETQPENEYLNHDEICETAVPGEAQTYETFNVHAIAKSEVNNNNNENDTSPIEDLSTPPKPGTIAEREHRKWEEAAPIENNPYSKENLEKRSFDKFLPKTGGISTISNQYDRNKFDNTMNGAVSMNDISKYERDYHVNAEKSEEDKSERIRTRSMSREEEPSQNGFANNVVSYNELVPERRKTNLVRLSSWSDRKKPDIEIRRRLPSVKELAKQFSGQNSTTEVKRPSITRNQMVHSLTARSMSKEFREGLKNNVNKIYNRNVKTNGQEEDGGSVRESQMEEETHQDAAENKTEAVSAQ